MIKECPTSGLTANSKRCTTSLGRSCEGLLFPVEDWKSWRKSMIPDTIQTTSTMAENFTPTQHSPILHRTGSPHWTLTITDDHLIAFAIFLRKNYAVRGLTFLTFLNLVSNFTQAYVTWLTCSMCNSHGAVCPIRMVQLTWSFMTTWWDTKSVQNRNLTELGFFV